MSEIQPPSKRSLQRWIDRELSDIAIARMYEVNPETVRRWKRLLAQSEVGPQLPL